MLTQTAIQFVFRIVATAFLLAFTMQLSALPPSQKAREKLDQNQKYIVAIAVTMENFGTADQKKAYDDLKNDYMASLAYYFEGRFFESYNTGVKAQEKIEKLYEQVSLDYINRTNEMLQGTIKHFVELRVKYDKEGELARRYLKKRRAPKEKLPYDPKEYHLLYDQYTIYGNVEMGFHRLGDARRIRQDALDLEMYFEASGEEGDNGSKDKIDNRVHAMRIHAYLGVIELCRDAKMNVVRIYQLVNRNDIYSVQTKHRENPFAVEKKLAPVFDPRIPDEYKKDANDALKLIHEDEIRVKVEQKGYTDDNNNGGGNNNSGGTNNGDDS